MHGLFTEYLLLIADCVHIDLIKHHKKEQLKIEVKRKYVKQHRRSKTARLSTFGNAGSSHLDYPKDSDLMESFNCNQTQVNRYKISLLKPSTKALVLSCKVSIRTDNRGFLSLQYMIRNEDGQICFVEYYCCPDEEVPESES